MKYYKIVEDNILVYVGSGSKVPSIGTEITKEEYDAYCKTFNDAPVNTFESVYRFSDTENQYVAFERTEEEKADWYLEVVQNGTVALEDVPADYQSAAKERLPKTEAEELLEEVANYDY